MPDPRAWKVLALLVLAGVAGCDPCAGVADCRDAPRIVVDGHVLRTGTGLPVPGTTVQVVADLGPSMQESSSTMTDSDGLFSASVSTPSYGVYGYTLVVTPPDGPTYRAAGLLCQSTGIRGSGCQTGPLADRPHFPYLLAVRYRGPDETPVRNVRIAFRRTGGGSFYGDSLVAGEYRARTDDFGNAQFMGLYVFTTDLQPVIGEVIVRFPPPMDSSVVSNVSVRPTFAFRSGPTLIRVAAGPSLRYSYALYAGTPSTPAPGATVRFVRTGGIATAQPQASGTTAANGQAVLDLRPLRSGTVIGDLFVEAAGSAPFVIRGLSLETHDDDLAPLAGSWNVTTGGADAEREARPPR